jgi:hypothetical protein
MTIMLIYKRIQQMIFYDLIYKLILVNSCLKLNQQKEINIFSLGIINMFE